MNNKLLNVYKYRKVFFAISIILILTGVAFLIIKGVSLDIQFKGGAIIKYTYTGEVTQPEQKAIADLVNTTIGRNTSVQISNEGTDQQCVVLNLAGEQGLSTDDEELLDAALKENYPEHEFALSEMNTVEPFIGARFLRNGIISIVLASVLIVLYVWFRFKQISGLSAGVMAVVALLHDCAIVFSIFVIFGIPIGDIFVAVMLTIIGYSINNTIIIYDRIRENYSIAGKMEVDELVNLSITQTMSRSINTTLTTVAAIIIIYVFATVNGIQSIQNFALPMAAGMLSGFYSSNFIACNLWVMWQKKKHRSSK